MQHSRIVYFFKWWRRAQNPHIWETTNENFYWKCLKITKCQKFCSCAFCQWTLEKLHKKSVKAVKPSKDEFCDRCVGGYCSPFNLFCLCAASVKVSWPLRGLLCSCLEEMAPLLRLPPVSPSCAANMRVRRKFPFNSHWLFNCLTFANLASYMHYFHLARRYSAAPTDNVYSPQTRGQHQTGGYP